MGAAGLPLPFAAEHYPVRFRDLDSVSYTHLIHSNTYAVQWPKGTWRRYPEIDRAGWFPVAEARRKILGGQEPFIDRLLATLEGRK